MLQIIKNSIVLIDKKIFFFLNNNISNKFFDLIMPIITHKNFLILFAISCLIYTCFKVKNKKKVIIISILSITLSDITASRIIKPYFKRIRPCHKLENVIQRSDIAHSYSLPSSHSANAFSFAIAISYCYSPISIFIIIFASLVSFSRIYVGVHYPVDVIFGAFVGIICAYIIIKIYKIIIIKSNCYFKSADKNSDK